MSAQKFNISITPPQYPEKKEFFEINGFYCPVCKGSGVIYEEDEQGLIFDEPCTYCKGREKVKAMIAISWEPDDKW